MDVFFVSAVLDSTYRVLSTMAQIHPVAGEPTLKKGTLTKGDVTGYTDMETNGDKATFAMSFAEDTICHIAQRMLGEQIDTIDDSIIDLTGELVNMVVGNTKKVLEDQGYDFTSSTPSMLTGKNIDFHHAYDHMTVVLPFTTDNGEFFVEFSYE